jgi:asparagine synthetase B (glutamine-hydrolysing)
MLERVAHRGPDDAGSIEIGNGEIYDHEHVRARLGGPEALTDSDNEVALLLLDAHGPESLVQFNGMFAVVAAAEDGRFVTARDPVGIKPAAWCAPRARSPKTRSTLPRRRRGSAVGTQDSPDLAAARLVAEHTGSEHHERVYTAQDALDVLPTVVRAIESFDPGLVRSAVPNYLLAEMTVRDVKVVLTGEGARRARATTTCASSQRR